MRILIISNYYPPLEFGGREQLTQDVAQQLAERGNETFILTSDHRAEEIVQPEAHVARVLHLESPDHNHYRPHYIFLRSWWEWQNCSRLAQAVHTFVPDLIFINGMWNLPVSLAQAAEELSPGRVVYYMASTWPTEIDAHRAYWTLPTRRPWLQLPKRAVGIVWERLLPKKRRNQLAFAHVLCVSSYIRQHLIDQAGISPAQIIVVHNGIDTKTFAMRNLEETRLPVRLLYAGRLTPEKGVHTVIEALAELLHHQPQLPLALTLIGGGAPEYVDSLKNRVVELNLDNAVQFRCQVPRQSMPAIFDEHDILLLPSIWREPLARVTQEAMACGLVVIGTTTGGTPEILKDGENGLTFQAGNAKMLAEKINLAAIDRDLRISLARAARYTVEEHFTFDRMIDELEAYFRHVVTIQGLEH